MSRSANAGLAAAHRADSAQRQQLLRQEQDALEVDVHKRVNVLLRHVGDGAATRHAAVVDEEVEGVAAPHRAKRLAHSGHERVGRPDVADVELVPWFKWSLVPVAGRAQHG
jgi:hypothetical protein